MSDSKFEPKQDSRPTDSVWPGAIWPVPADTVLRGKFVELKPQSENDAEELFTALAFDEVWHHVAGRPKNVDELKLAIKSKQADPNWQAWTVRLIETGEVVGSTSYLDTSVNDARTEIGSTSYNPNHWGTKVNPETKLLLLEYAFEKLHMGRVQLKTDIRNQRSQRAIAKLGADYEGVLRRYQRRSDGTVRDTVLFSITAEEWPNVRARLEQRLAGE